ncbi:POZ [Glarea lozoyensis ATCC 20868]|uniref:POZ n=1 Tax=Glarea lozoyensis (strain ATCC 20868 / MF5171) TaxID=1116229 RepID=S3D427_GLAL2|nr:POZ [Glarea lozoyensis ATCC 20868]EPE31869.1 POZ [Glarea lozoyensis ATCC 20868]
MSSGQDCDSNKDYFDCKLKNVKEELRLRREHGQYVHALISACSDIATLYVGKDKTQIRCHKILLGFFSRFFESALYSNFAEAASGEVHLPEDEVQPIQDFVSWLYSGQSPQELDVNEDVDDEDESDENMSDKDASDEELSDENASDEDESDEDEFDENRPDKGEQDVITPQAADALPNYEDVKLDDCKLELELASRWLLGDKLISPRFTNYLMNLLLNNYGDNGRLYFSWEVEFAYNNTVAGSELRLLFRDLIAIDGPLRYSRFRWSAADFGERDRWVLLLAKGGDLIEDCVLGGFTNLEEDITLLPWARRNRQKYMQKVADISVEEWIRIRCPTQVATEASSSS